MEQRSESQIIWVIKYDVGPDVVNLITNTSNAAAQAVVAASGPTARPLLFSSRKGIFIDWMMESFKRLGSLSSVILIIKKHTFQNRQ